MDPEFRRILARMDYYNYQEGLISRHFNQQGGWDDHNRNAREYVLSAIEYFKPDTVTVLGSGWLLEFPIVEVLERNLNINLVDIVHPPEVLRQVSSFANVRVIEADVSGGVIFELWNKIRKTPVFRRLRSLDPLKVPMLKLDFDPGLVVSLNILTQLETLPVKMLNKKTAVNEKEIEKFRVEIQARHIDYLRQFNSVLITDKEEIIISKSGMTQTKCTLLHEIVPGKFHKEWTWNFDLRSQDNYTSKSVMKVIAETFENE